MALEQGFFNASTASSGVLKRWGGGGEQEGGRDGLGSGSYYLF